MNNFNICHTTRAHLLAIFIFRWGIFIFISENATLLHGSENLHAAAFQIYKLHTKYCLLTVVPAPWEDPLGPGAPALFKRARCSEQWMC